MTAAAAPALHAKSSARVRATAAGTQHADQVLFTLLREAAETVVVKEPTHQSVVIISTMRRRNNPITNNPKF